MALVAPKVFPTNATNMSTAHLMRFIDGMRGEDGMEGNLDRSSRIGDKSDEVRTGDDLNNNDDVEEGSLDDLAESENIVKVGDRVSGDDPMSNMYWSVSNEESEALARQNMFSTPMAGIGP